MRPEYSIETWDWKEQPDWESIQALQDKGYVFIMEVPDTYSDMNVLILTKKRITEKQVQEIYNQISKEGETK